MKIPSKIIGAVFIGVAAVQWGLAQWCPTGTQNQSGWGDSYSANGKCYCASTFDHDIGLIPISTPYGTKTVRQICDAIGAGPGQKGNPVYNDIQCGNGPANNAGDEDPECCPGRVDGFENGCQVRGPMWDLSVFGPSSNKIPTVKFTAPVNGTVMGVSTNLSLKASASDSDGTISKVEFRKNGILIATDSTSPYEYTVSGLTVGAYTFQARAYDNSFAIKNDTTRVTVSTTSALGAGGVNANSNLQILSREKLELEVLLPEVGVFTLKVFDVSGSQLISAQKINGQKGLNKVTLSNLLDKNDTYIFSLEYKGSLSHKKL